MAGSSGSEASGKEGEEEEEEEEENSAGEMFLAPKDGKHENDDGENSAHDKESAHQKPAEGAGGTNANLRRPSDATDTSAGIDISLSLDSDEGVTVPLSDLAHPDSNSSDNSGSDIWLRQGSADSSTSGSRRRRHRHRQATRPEAPPSLSSDDGGEHHLIGAQIWCRRSGHPRSRRAAAANVHEIVQNLVDQWHASWEFEERTAYLQTRTLALREQVARAVSRSRRRDRGAWFRRPAAVARASDAHTRLARRITQLFARLDAATTHAANRHANIGAYMQTARSALERMDAVA
jgi:hypothetical protein